MKKAPTMLPPLRRTSNLPCAGLFLFVLVLGRIAGAQTYKDDKYGYTVRPPSGWAGTPVAPDDRGAGVVSKWNAKRPEDNITGEMTVRVMDRARPAPASPEEKPAGGYERALVDENPFARLAMASFDEWIKRDRPGFDVSNPEDVSVKAPSSIDPKARVFEGTWSARGVALYISILVVETEERTWVLELYCADSKARKHKPLFVSALRSFRLIEQVVEKSAVPTTEREAARKRARDDAERVPGWWYSESENYFIVTNMEGSKKAQIRPLQSRLEAIRTLYETDFPPSKPITAVSIVRVCKDRKTYYDYGGRPGTGGYWYAPAKELVLFTGGSDKSLAEDVINHEAFHQYIYYACGEIAPHSWYNEGYGDYYAGALIQGRRVNGVGPLRMRVDTIKEAVRQGTHVPVKEIIRYSQQQYYANAQLCYAQGWSLIYFLNKAVPAGHPWLKILPTYLKVLQETESQDKAVDAAFTGVDLEEFEKAWMLFTEKGQPVRN